MKTKSSTLSLDEQVEICALALQAEEVIDLAADIPQWILQTKTATL